MVLGQGLRLYQVMEYFGKALIGFFYGFHISEHTLDEYIYRFWALEGGYGSIFYIHTRGWLGFVYLEVRMLDELWWGGGIGIHNS
jgi:hypothetical protein